MHLRNVSTFFQEETFSATLSTPHLPRSYLLLSCSPRSLSGDLCLASFCVFRECLLVPDGEKNEKKTTESSSGEVQIYREISKKSSNVVFVTAINTVTPPSKVDSPTRQDSEMHRPDFSTSCSQISGYILSLELIKTSAAPPFVQISTVTCVICSNWNAVGAKNKKPGAGN